MVAAIDVDLPGGRTSEVKVWAHTITPEGASERLAARVTFGDGTAERTLDLGGSDGSAVLPLDPGGVRLKIVLADAPGR
jgi:hypothetical protein